MPEPNQVYLFFHCAKCLDERPPGLSPREWAHLEVGWTEKGVQVWCVRHELNVVHLDFLGQMVHTPEPWIWLQEYEASGEADCGCRLDSSGPDGTPGAAFYLCPKHDAALDLLAVLEALVSAHDELPSMLTEAEWAAARAAIAKAKG